jgi:hypothetical protein
MGRFSVFLVSTMLLGAVVAACVSDLQAPAACEDADAMLGVIEAVHDFSRPRDPTLQIDDPVVPSGSDPDKALVHVGRSVHVFVESATGVMVRGSLDDLVVGRGFASVSPVLS